MVLVSLGSFLGASTSRSWLLEVLHQQPRWSQTDQEAQVSYSPAVSEPEAEKKDQAIQIMKEAPVLSVVKLKDVKAS